MVLIVTVQMVTRKWHYDIRFSKNDDLVGSAEGGLILAGSKRIGVASHVTILHLPAKFSSHEQKPPLDQISNYFSSPMLLFPSWQ
jgi:hypothetical protein